MAKNILIKENGTQRSIQGVGSVRTGSNNGGDVWVPEDETGLEAITITKNGEYSAEQEGVYGFSEVSVQVDAPEKIYFYVPPRVAYLSRGDAITWSGCQVHMIHEDGTETDVTDQCDFYPPEGTPISKVTVKEMKATWRPNRG